MFLRASIQAYYASDATAEALQIMQDDRRLYRVTLDSQPGGIQQACSVLANQKSPDLLIVETQETGTVFLESLSALAEVCDTGTKVVVIGKDNDILLYRQLLEMGIQEYLPLPVGADQLLATIERLFSSAGAENDCQVLAFIGARGGAGSSTVAINTAYCLAQTYAEEVILLDLDLAFGTAALALNMLPNQNIAEALLQSGRLDAVMLERFLSHYDEYLSIMAAPGRLDASGQFNLAAFDVLMEMLSKRSAFVVLDMPHQWEPWIYQTLMGANEVVITATSALASLKSTKVIFDKLAPNRGVDSPIRLVMNNLGASRKTELLPNDFEKAVSVKPSALIANNPSLFGKAMNNGELIAQSEKRSEAARQYDQLATILSGRAPVSAKPKRFSLLRGKTA